MFSTPSSETTVSVAGDTVRVDSPGGQVAITGESVQLTDLLAVEVTGIEVSVDGGGHLVDLSHVGFSAFPNLARVAVNGGDGPDTILGSRVDDLLLGGGGDDLITGGDGHDEIHGGAGDDFLNGNRGNDTLQGQAGDDRILGGIGQDILLAGSGDNRVRGHGGRDFIVGGSGSDRIDGGPGADRINGRGGHDRLRGGAGNDHVLGGAGSDSLDGEAGDDTLRGHAGADSLFGGEGHDRITGSSGNNLLVGSSGDDYLQGGDDHDLIIGGAGRDRLRGGAGEDLLIGSATAYDSYPDQLAELLTGWTGSTDYLTRVNRLQDVGEPRHLEPGSTVHDDDQPDDLRGGSGRDWFFQPGSILGGSVQAGDHDLLQDNGVDELVARLIDTSIVVPAFPGAEGYAATTTGGRGGRVIEVTNLDDQGPGSLRAAVEETGPRTIVFRVGGVITWLSELEISSPDLTIAGHTAPGDGISLGYDGHDGGQLHGVLTVATHNVIIRHLRIRRGEAGEGGDSLRIRGGSTDILIDHVSVSWGTDENIDIYSNNGLPIRRVTIQNSLIGPALDTGRGAAMGVLVGGRRDDASWQQVSDVDLHGNVFAHNTHRNPRVMAHGVKVVNNVVYNWRARAGSTASDTEIDWIGNMFLRGPQSNVSSNRLLFHATTLPDGQTLFSDATIYIAGNLAPDLGFVDSTAENWDMISNHYVRVGEPENELPARLQRQVPLPEPDIPITVADANDLLTGESLADIGATSRLDENGNRVANRDLIDEGILGDVISGTGNYQQPSTAAEASGGYAPIESVESYPDLDHDGMSDTWETRNLLDPHDPADGPVDYDFDGWTNLEEFLNGTSPRRPG